MGQHSSDVRQHILDIGKALILGKGFTAVGLAELLTAARVPKGSFYYYFESKEQFGEALLESYFAAYLTDLEALLAGGAPARERLMRYWRRWAEIQNQGASHEQCLVVKLGAEVSDLSEAMRSALRRGTDGIITRLAACAAQGVADGSLAAPDPGLMAQALYELWLGASLLTKVRRDPSALSAAMAATESLLGLAQPGQPAFHCTSKGHSMKILMVLTSHDQLGDTGRKTGFWLEEFAAPYYVFRDAGAELVLASPRGGQPPLDPKSDEPGSQTDATRRFRQDPAAGAALAHTLKLSEAMKQSFDAVFYPGGHGPLWDLAEDPDSVKLIEATLAAGKPVAAVCHAPGVLRHVKGTGGAALVKGRKVTGFSNTEETAVGLSAIVPFLVEDMLLGSGANYSKGPDWGPYVLTDGNLITGQNPASSAPAAAALLAQVRLSPAR